METHESLQSTEPQPHEVDADNDPPYSRIFIVCPRTTTETKIRELCSEFGTIQFVKMVEDKMTKQFKGVVYVKYARASEAAKAIEALHGKQIEPNEPPMKVMIAEAKSSSKRGLQPQVAAEDTPPRSRLFVVCEKTMSEDELSKIFAPFGDMEYCKLVKDKNTGESKGCAYVKYFKSSTAAAALETVNQESERNQTKLKVVIAEPKTKRSDPFAGRDMFPPPMPRYPPYYDFPPMGMPPMHGMMPPYPSPMGYGGGMPPAPHASKTRLFVVCSKSVTKDQLARLFGRYPGMEYCDLKMNKQTGESKGFAYVNYSTPQAAAIAREQCDGLEYPPGASLKVIFAEPQGSGPSSSPSSGGPPMNPMSSAPGSPTRGAMGADVTDRNYPENSRLFIVMTGKTLPEYTLHELFAPFGGLEYIRLQKDKNFGYVKYNNALSASYAVHYIDGSEVHGARMKVQIALPPSSESRGPKRQRI